MVQTLGLDSWVSVPVYSHKVPNAKGHNFLLTLPPCFASISTLPLLITLSTINDKINQVMKRHEVLTSLMSIDHRQENLSVHHGLVA